MPIAPDGTGYTAIARDDGTYAVEVVSPGDLPDMVRGFASEREAERWIMDKIGRKPLKDLPDIATIR
jgi:hypothetical protein